MAQCLQLGMGGAFICSRCNITRTNHSPNDPLMFLSPKRHILAYSNHNTAVSLESPK